MLLFLKTLAKSKMIDNIIQVISKEMGVGSDEIFSKSKKAPAVRARHLCMYAIARTNHRATQEEIASVFKVRRAAVSKAISNIEFEMKYYKSARTKTNRILHELRGQ
jgi:chromosomal replication initiation ATPase DnaA